jgi:hypothetical protein
MTGNKPGHCGIEPIERPGHQMNEKGDFGGCGSEKDVCITRVSLYTNTNDIEASGPMKSLIVSGRRSKPTQTYLLATHKKFDVPMGIAYNLRGR